MDLLSMMRSTVEILERSSFILSQIKVPSEMSFDLVARRDKDLVLIKLIRDKEELRSQSTGEMKVLARVLSASPILLIPSSRSSTFRDGVLYVSHGIPLMTLNTLFDHLVEEVPPFVYYCSGGHFVTVEGNRIRDIRERHGISLGALANEIGVSRRAIQMYESGMGVDLEMALKIEEVMGVELIIPLDPFSRNGPLEEIRESISGLDVHPNDVLEHLNSIGMEVIPTTRCPFDALARSGEDLVMTSIDPSEREIRMLGSTLSEITRVTGNESFLVATGPIKGRNIGGTPLLTVDDVKKVDTIEDLLELIRNRRKH